MLITTRAVSIGNNVVNHAKENLPSADNITHKKHQYW